MPDLHFQVEGAAAEPFAVAPLLKFKLRLTTDPAGAPIRGVALQCQIRIEPLRRRYDPQDRDRLTDLFGSPDRWGETMRSMLWTHTSVGVPPFTGTTLVDLPVPCTYDFNIAATKYFYALEGGDVALTLLFSGTVFYDADDGVMQIAQIPWEKEATYRLPVATWQQLMDLYYPNSAWLNLPRDVFDRLYRYKMARGLPTWEQTLAHLLDRAGDTGKGD